MAELSLKPTYAPTTVEAPHTPHSVEVELIKDGRCHIHGVILMKRKKFGLGTKIIHEECPRCACERINNGDLSNDQIQQELSNLACCYKNLSQELGGAVERIQSELKFLEEDAQAQEELDTQRLERLIEKAIPTIVERLTESQEQQAPSDSAEELSVLRENLAELQSRFDKAGEEGKKVIAAAMTDAIQQVKELNIKYDDGTNQEALQREIDEIKVELGLVRRSLSCLSNQVETSSEESIRSLLRRFSSLEAVIEEQDKINRKIKGEVEDIKDEVEDIKDEVEDIRGEVEETKRQIDSIRKTLEDNQGLKPPATVSIPGTDATDASSCEWSLPPTSEPISLKMIAVRLQSNITTDEVVNYCNQLYTLTEDTVQDKNGFEVELPILAIKKILDTARNKKISVSMPCLRALGQLVRYSSICVAVSRQDNAILPFLLRLSLPQGDACQMVKDQKLTDHDGEWGVYTGVVLRLTGKPYGYGHMIYEEGSSYAGEWHHGRWHGFGHANWTNGDTYQGEYSFEQRNGRGTYSWSDGRVYDGMHFNDKSHGKGTFTWPDGATYEGYFVHGQREGQGRYEFSDGGFYEGAWVNGFYEGYGECHWKDGRCYKGEWKEGKANGQGIETYPDGRVRHDGLWIDDTPS